MKYAIKGKKIIPFWEFVEAENEDEALEILALRIDEGYQVDGICDVEEDTDVDEQIRALDMALDGERILK